MLTKITVRISIVYRRNKSVRPEQPEKRLRNNAPAPRKTALRSKRPGRYRKRDDRPDKSGNPHRPARYTDDRLHRQAPGRPIRNDRKDVFTRFPALPDRPARYKSGASGRPKRRNPKKSGCLLIFKFLTLYLYPIRQRNMVPDNIAQIDLKSVLRQKAPSLAGKIPGFIVNYLIRTIHQEELNDILRRYHDKQGVDFMTELLDYFDLTLELVNEKNIPAEGRYTFASNHPLGGLDGICLSAVIGSRFDGKIKYPVNDLLLYLTNLKSIFIPINKHGNQGKDVARLLNEAYASDNQIVTFPAGLCSRKQGGRIVDPEWKKSFIQKTVEYERDVIPVYFEARNSDRFYRLANLRKKLGIRMNYEMIYLPDEMFRCKHRTFRIHFGEPIPWQTFGPDKTASGWAAWVKEKVYNMSDK